VQLCSEASNIETLQYTCGHAEGLCSPVECAARGMACDLLNITGPLDKAAHVLSSELLLIYINPNRALHDASKMCYVDRHITKCVDCHGTMDSRDSAVHRCAAMNQAHERREKIHQHRPEVRTQVKENHLCSRCDKRRKEKRPSEEKRARELRAFNEKRAREVAAINARRHAEAAARHQHRREH